MNTPGVPHRGHRCSPPSQGAHQAALSPHKGPAPPLGCTSFRPEPNTERVQSPQALASPPLYCSSIPRKGWLSPYPGQSVTLMTWLCLPPSMSASLLLSALTGRDSEEPHPASSSTDTQAPILVLRNRSSACRLYGNGPFPAPAAAQVRQALLPTVPRAHTGTCARCRPHRHTRSLRAQCPAPPRAASAHQGLASRRLPLAGTRQEGSEEESLGPALKREQNRLCSNVHGRNLLLTC